MPKKPSLHQLATVQQLDTVAKLVGSQVQSLSSANLGWQEEYAYGRAGGLVKGSKRELTTLGKQHFTTLTSNLARALRQQTQFLSRYPSLRGLVPPFSRDEDNRALAEEQVFEWLHQRVTQRQQQGGKQSESLITSSQMRPSLAGPCFRVQPLSDSKAFYFFYTERTKPNQQNISVEGPAEDGNQLQKSSAGWQSCIIGLLSFKVHSAFACTCRSGC
jgi:hypothetical protein